MTLAPVPRLFDVRLPRFTQADAPAVDGQVGETAGARALSPLTQSVAVGVLMGVITTGMLTAPVLFKAMLLAGASCAGG